MTWQLTPEELGVEWLTWLRDVRQRPENTWQTYARVLAAWLDWCPRFGVDPLQPELTQLERFMIRPRVGGGIGSAATQKMDAVVLRGWYRWLLDRDYLEGKNPARLLYHPSVMQTSGRPIPDDAWMWLWGSELGDVARTALGLGYFAGMRTFELEHTPRSDLGSDLVKVTRKGGKVQRIPWKKLSLIVHHRLPHLLPDPSTLSRAIRVVREHGDVAIFPSDFERAFLRLVKPWPGHLTPHMLRHSLATNMLRPEVNMPLQIVQEMMGHANIRDTMLYVESASGRLDDYFPELRDGM